MRRTLLLCLAISSLQLLVAQQKDIQQKFQLAQSYERANDWERAVGIYEELYSSDSTSVVIFESLRRGYMQLKRHDDAIRIIHSQLRIRPDDIGLRAQLGIVHAREGDEARARETWDRAIDIGRNSANTYYIVANAAVESRLLERAVNIYLQGRSAMGDPMMFTAEVANLYAAMMNFAGATREYIKLVQRTPSQLNFVQSRMGIFTYRADARQDAAKAVEEALRRSNDNTALYQLFAWLLMEGKEFERAFDTYVQLDERTNAGGRELFNFAERAFREKAYDVASKTYQTIIVQHPEFDRMAFAKFGHARTEEELLNTRVDAEKLFLVSPLVGANGDDTGNTLPHPSQEPQPGAVAVIAKYREIVRQHPHDEIAARALHRIATIQFRMFFDLDAAASTLVQLQRDHNALPHRIAEATLLLGDISLTKGDLKEAARQYQRCTGFSGTKERALFRIAETEFFQGKFEETTRLLLELTREPKSDVANDALSLLTFIQEHSQSEMSALNEFAKAIFLIRQRKFPDALRILQSVEQVHPTSSLLDETLTLTGDLLASMGRYAEGVSSFESVIDRFPESTILDRVMMKMAYIHERKLNNPTEAIANYRKILERFPHSLYANAARKRIRELRGETL